MNRKEKPGLIYCVMSILIYLASFFFSAYYDEGLQQGIYGVDCFKYGLFCFLPVVIMDLFNLSLKFWWIAIWLANPLYLISIYCYFKNKDIGGYSIAISIILALLFLAVSGESYGNVTTESRVVGEKLAGYYLWLSSFIVMFVALLNYHCHKTKNKNTGATSTTRCCSSPWATASSCDSR